MNTSQSQSLPPPTNILNKIIILISYINYNITTCSNDDYINYRAYPILVKDNMEDMKKILIFPPFNDENDTLDRGYLRYKNGINPDQISDGHNGLKCLIYGILFRNGKIINDTIIKDIINILYATPECSFLKDIINPSNTNNYKFSNISLSSPNTNKRHILDVLNTIMCLIDASFSYGHSTWGIQSGKKGESLISNQNPPPNYNIDTLGYLIYIIAFYNIRWLTLDNINNYREQFKNSLQNCDSKTKNNITRCKENTYWAKPIVHIDLILAPQQINSSPYIIF